MGYHDAAEPLTFGHQPRRAVLVSLPFIYVDLGNCELCRSWDLLAFCIKTNN